MICKYPALLEAKLHPKPSLSSPRLETPSISFCAKPCECGVGSDSFPSNPRDFYGFIQAKQPFQEFRLHKRGESVSPRPGLTRGASDPLEFMEAMQFCGTRSCPALTSEMRRSHISAKVRCKLQTDSKICLGRGRGNIFRRLAASPPFPLKEAASGEATREGEKEGLRTASGLDVLGDICSEKTLGLPRLHP